jgi:hypothetical protein|tara:strand:- start:520 stop:1302 length:783 start_codon:yes stop_codon:yes gene_type:complete
MKSKILAISVLLLIGCNSYNTTSPYDDGDNNSGSGGSGGGGNTNLPVGFTKFIDTHTDVYISGNYVVVETAGIPNHNSPYWGAGHANYESPHSGMNINPNIITTQNFKFYIPLNPTVAGMVASTPLGAIGVSLSGVPFYNQYAGPNNQPLAQETGSFDVYYGHPQQTGQYHYHWEPLYLTSADNSILIGYSLDGFPIYGPTNQTDGNYPTNLDEINGHTHVTNEYPDGIYHYHVTSTVPYLIGGYKGTVGATSGGGYFTN